MVIPQRFKSFLVFDCCHLIAVFSLLSGCYDVVFFIFLLQLYLCESDSISQKYQIMVVINMLKNLSCRYYSNYIITFVGIYCAIRILFHSLWFLTICLLDLSIYFKFESIKLFFL